jgi:hypothetical protein
MSEPRTLRILRNRQGATVPIVAVCIAMLIGFAALAVDLGMLLDNRNEAQRAADAAALAGASALLAGHIAGAPTSVREDTATARAKHYASLNQIRGQHIDAAEVDISFPVSNSRIAATVIREGIAPLFAGIFGKDALRVGATAHAMWYQGSSVSCIRPFGVPDTASFTLAEVGKKVLIWRKDAREFFPLFRQFSTGSNVRDAIKDLICDPTVVQVGDTLSHNESSNDTSVSQGQVDQGIDYLFSLDPDIKYNPALYGDQWDGFNTPNWRGSPRVMNLIIYKVSESSNTRFVVKSFMTVFLAEPLQNAPKGDRELYGIVLPTKAAAGGVPCSGANCCDLCFNFRLVQ